jgi:flagellar basal body-associated protein FliL
MELKSITRDDDDVQTNKQRSQDINIYKNYIPLCITVGVVGIGLYVYKSKQVVSQQPMMQQPAPIIQQKEIDQFEFN